MEYFLWSNRLQKFWRAEGDGLTLLVHEAGRYTAERAVRIAKSINTDAGTSAMVLRATPADRIDIPAAVRLAERRGRFDDSTAPPEADIDPAFLLWDNKNTGFYKKDGSFTYRTHRATRFTAEEAMELIGSGGVRPGGRELLPCRAPPVGVAAAAWEAALREAASNLQGAA